MARVSAPVLPLILRNHSMQRLVFKYNALISSLLIIFQMEHVTVFQTKCWDANGVDMD